MRSERRREREKGRPRKRKIIDFQYAVILSRFLHYAIIFHWFLQCIFIPVTVKFHLYPSLTLITLEITIRKSLRERCMRKPNRISATRPFIWTMDVVYLIHKFKFLKGEVGPQNTQSSASQIVHHSEELKTVFHK